MNCAIICSNKISSKTWIETQLIECFYDIIEPRKIFIPKGENRGQVSGNTILGQILRGKYQVEEFPYSWEEFGVGAVQKRNIEMLADANFLLALNDGKSRTVGNCIKIALSKQIPMNIRYMTDYSKIKLR